MKNQTKAEAISKEYQKQSSREVAIAPMFLEKSQNRVVAKSEQYQKNSKSKVALFGAISHSQTHHFNGEIKRPIVATIKPTIVATLTIQEVNRWQNR